MIQDLKMEYDCSGNHDLKTISIENYDNNFLSRINDYHGITKISWNYHGEFINFYNKDTFNFCIQNFCLDSDKEKILVIRTPAFNECKTNEFIIYDGLGNVIKDVPIPKLTSSLAKEFHANNETFVDFYLVMQDKNFNNKIIVTLLFMRDYYESRIFNINTLEFEECIYSGRM